VVGNMVCVQMTRIYPLALRWLSLSGPARLTAQDVTVAPLATPDPKNARASQA